MRSGRLHQLADLIRSDFRADTERGRLVRATVATASQHVMATLLAFAGSLIYARALGSHGYGHYAYVLAWIAVLSIPTALGTPMYITREAVRTPNRLRAWCRWADARIIVSGFAAMILMAGVFFVPQAADARWLFLMAAPMPFLLSAASLRSALIQARGYAARSQWPRLVLAPGLTLVAFSCLWLWRGSVTSLDLMIITVVATVLTLLVNTSQLRRITRNEQDRPTLEAHLRNALPFMWVAGLFLLNGRIDLLMLGVLRGAHDAGVYAVASRAAELTCFVMVTGNLILGPKIANLYQTGQHALLQRLVSGATRRMLVASFPIALVLIVGARPLLHHLYGSEFSSAAILLQVLAAAQIVTVVSGPLGTLLNMTGHEKVAAKNMLTTVAINVTLNAVLIPRYGALGAAMATATSLLVSRALLWYFARQYLEFYRLGVTSR